MPQRQTVGEMTRDELEAFVREIVRREAAEHRQTENGKADERSLDDVFASIDRNLIVLPPGAKSSLDLWREDRER